MNERSIFLEALEITAPAERAAFLDRACNGNADLRKGVEGLLAADARSGSFMRQPAGGDVTADLRPSEGPGSRVGPYKLLQEIGEGGMGVVYMAEQEVPVRRKVALKIIKPGMDSKQVVARFESERQALAMMDHPNIARVLDAGATESGRPYFVMELVKGVPITEFCDRNKLPADERLNLFVTVCNAIQHAHHKGIIHRDIKPSNVMVTLHDGVPVAKVIDFGVAKATAQKLTERTLFTAYGQMIGTPAYMSPEQAEMSGLDIDTRSDIFSLGVLLYELLTGTTPLDTQKLRKAGYAEMQRLIREEEAPRPSTRFSSMGGEATVLATNRGTDVRRLSQLLRSDLDWIVMKSLEKDRNRRYGSPANFAADVERYLAEQPVEACPPSAWYRFRKAYRRNRAALTTAAVVAAALLAGLAASIWQAVAASRAEAAALAERDEKEKARTEEARQREEAVKAADETKAANERLKFAYDQQRADQYAWDMRGLPLVWESGNVLEARRLLERQPEALRGFEWRYWDRLTHAEKFGTKLTFGSPNPQETPQWSFSGDGTRLALVQWPGVRGFGGLKQEGPKEEEAILTVWDLATRKVVRTHRFTSAGAASLNLGNPSNGLPKLSHDGKRILLSQTLFTSNNRNGLTGITPAGSRVEVFDVERDKVIFSRRYHKEPPAVIVANAHLTQDGRRLIVAQTTREMAGMDAPVPRGNPVGAEIQVFDLDAGDKEPRTVPEAVLRAVSADGTRFVTSQPVSRAGSFGLVAATEPREHTIWDTESGKELGRVQAFGLPLYIHGQELFAVVRADGQNSDRVLLKSWSTETGKERLAVPLPFAARRQAAPRGPDGKQIEPVSASMALAFLVFDRVGKSVLVGRLPDRLGQNDLDIVTVIDAQTGKIRATVDHLNSAAGATTGALMIGPSSSANLRQPIFTADGSQFVVADDNLVRTFDTQTGKPVLTLRGHETAIAARAEGPDGSLWSVEADGTLKQWSLEPPTPVRIATEATASPSLGVPLFRTNTDGAWVARVHVERVDLTDEYRSIVEVWDTTGKVRKVFEKRGERRGTRNQFGADPTAVALSADGRRVALLRPPVLPPLPKGEKIDPNDRFKDTAGSKAIAPADLTVWDVGSGKEIYHAEMPASTEAETRFSQPSFTADGTTVTLDQSHRGKTSLRVFDVQNRREKPAIHIGEEFTRAVELSPDGRRVAVTTWGAQQPVAVAVYDVATGKRQTIDARATSSSRLTWSPDGKKLLVTDLFGPKRGLNLYDATTGKLSASLSTADQSERRDQDGSTYSSMGPAFSPDGRRVAAITNTRQSRVIKIWDTESGKDLLVIPLAPTPGAGNDAHYLLAFTPDMHGLRVVTTRSRQSGIGKFPNDTQLPSAITVTTYDATPRREPVK